MNLLEQVGVTPKDFYLLGGGFHVQLVPSTTECVLPIQCLETLLATGKLCVDGLVDHWLWAIRQAVISDPRGYEQQWLCAGWCQSTFGSHRVNLKELISPESSRRRLTPSGLKGVEADALEDWEVIKLGRGI